MTEQAGTGGARRGAAGRPRAATRADVERVAMTLFARQGFVETTIDEIAAAAGISRRTFFRYFGSKLDVVWGDFEAGLRELARSLAAAPPSEPLVDVLRRCVIAFNTFDDEQAPWHRMRMTLILRVPALQARSTLKYAEWRAVVTEFVAARLGLDPDAFVPQLVGHTTLAAAVTAYEEWLRDPEVELGDLLDRAVRTVGDGLHALDSRGAAQPALASPRKARR